MGSRHLSRLTKKLIIFEFYPQSCSNFEGIFVLFTMLRIFARFPATISLISKLKRGDNDEIWQSFETGTTTT